MTKDEAKMLRKRQIKNIMTIATLLGMIFIGGNAWAQEKKRTTIDFEDQLIEGQARKPELFYLLQQRQFNFQRLIRLREDFIPEMERAAEGVQRRGN